MRLAELSPEQVCAWRLTVPEGHRFEATQALRQVLNRAVAWKLIDENPAKRGVPNPGRRCREQRPFDSWAQIRSLAERLGPSFGPMVVFAAATGLRPSELFALEQGDVDRAAGVVQVRRAYANGRVKQTKTRLSRRAVPLQAIALDANPGGECGAVAGRTAVVVRRDARRLAVYRNGRVVFRTIVAVGKPGAETPPGNLWGALSRSEGEGDGLSLESVAPSG